MSDSIGRKINRSKKRNKPFTSPLSNAFRGRQRPLAALANQRAEPLRQAGPVADQHGRVLRRDGLRLGVRSRPMAATRGLPSVLTSAAGAAAGRQKQLVGGRWRRRVRLQRTRRQQNALQGRFVRVLSNGFADASPAFRGADGRRGVGVGVIHRTSRADRSVVRLLVERFVQREGQTLVTASAAGATTTGGTPAETSTAVPRDRDVQAVRPVPGRVHRRDHVTVPMVHQNRRDRLRLVQDHSTGSTPAAVMHRSFPTGSTANRNRTAAAPTHIHSLRFLQQARLLRRRTAYSFGLRFATIHRCLFRRFLRQQLQLLRFPRVKIKAQSSSQLSQS